MPRYRQIIRAIVFACALSTAIGAQTPLRHFTEGVEQRYSRTQPVVLYTLTVRAGDTTGYDVRVAIRNAPDTFRLALAKHPEYDDRFFRFIQNVGVAQTNASIVREDSALWRVVAPGSVATISYRVQLPPQPAQRAAWQPFVSRAGALTGGTHSFMYVVGAELAPAHVRLELPEGWKIATGLTPTADPHTWYAASAYNLVESPILAGDFGRWTFTIDGVPHSVVYLPLRDAHAFDTATFVRNIERFANQVVQLFGRAPYREYIFQIQDGAYGALEHPNSVSLGIPSADLARDPSFGLAEIAHEYFHTWNLMRIRPAEYVGIDYRKIQPVPTLWFSEGLTMMYADLLLRRAQLPTHDSTRISHLEYLVTRYYDLPGNSHFSAEQVSRVAYGARPDALGDYSASTHLQGELLGTILDLIVRDATDGRRSMDDVMRAMLARYSGARGFTGADVERTVAEVCACNVGPFFAEHVRGAQPIAFDRYLGLAGLRLLVTRVPATRNGEPAPDSRIRAWNAPGDTTLSLIMGHPASVWRRAGLHSRDRVLSVNGTTPRTWPEFRQIIAQSRIGDTLRFVVRADSSQTRRNVTVVVTGYDQPLVKIEPVNNPTAKQARLLRAWLAGEATPVQ